jgi:tetratricopeptide (TPR) repeat protein
VLNEVGELDAALEVAADLTPRLEATNEVFVLIGLRALETSIFALRGRGQRASEVLDWLESSSRRAEDAQWIVFGLGSSAVARAALGQNEASAALLGEVDAFPGARGIASVCGLLPDMVRTAVGIGDLQLAERLVSGVESPYPYGAHAIVAASAALAEARGDLQAAADAYADAADRWEQFGVVREQAFALLGQGRCLLRLGRPTEARPVLLQARETFARLRAAPALAETDGLLDQTDDGP